MDNLWSQMRHEMQLGLYLCVLLVLSGVIMGLMYLILQSPAP